MKPEDGHSVYPDKSPLGGILLSILLGSLLWAGSLFVVSHLL
jgi:hypothetical protein